MRLSVEAACPTPAAAGALWPFAQHLVNALAELQELGVTFVSYSDSLDLTTSQGRLLFGVISSMAEFERDLIKERVRAGLSFARSNGTRSGKPIGRPKGQA